jgi:hypothetical protein
MEVEAELQTKAPRAFDHHGFYRNGGRDMVIQKKALGLLAVALLQGGQRANHSDRESSYRNEDWHFVISPPAFERDVGGKSDWLADFSGPVPASGLSNKGLKIGVTKRTFEEFVQEQERDLARGLFKVEKRNEIHIGQEVAKELVSVQVEVPSPAKAISLYVKRGDYVLSFVAMCPLSEFEKLEPVFRASLRSIAFEK